MLESDAKITLEITFSDFKIYKSFTKRIIKRPSFVASQELDPRTNLRIEFYDLKISESIPIPNFSALLSPFLSSRRAIYSDRGVKKLHNLHNIFNPLFKANTFSFITG